MIRSKTIGAVATLVGLGLLGAAAWAEGNATATPASSDDESGSSVWISSFVVKDGQCYLVTVTDKGKTSVPVAMSNCSDLGRLGAARTKQTVHWF